MEWVLIGADDLYTDVESLDSFSVSSESIEEEEAAAADVSRGNQIDLGMTSDALGFGVPLLNLDSFFRVAQSLHSDGGDEVDFHLPAGSADVVDTIQMHPQDPVSHLGFHGSESTANVRPRSSRSHGSNDSFHGDCVEADIGLLVDPVKSLGLVSILANLDDACRVGNRDDDSLRGFNNHSGGSKLKGDGSRINEENYELDDDECIAGLDDELVPWAFTHRLDNQRMKKLGKRTKMRNSKKMAHTYTKATCARGKHGFGLMVY